MYEQDNDDMPSYGYILDGLGLILFFISNFIYDADKQWFIMIIAGLCLLFGTVIVIKDSYKKYQEERRNMLK